ncbi:MAG: PEP-CTERM sorting domain-containing protein, partial [Planctomycetota bacterium]
TILTDWTIVVNSYRFGGRFDPDNRDYADADNGAPLPDLPSPADGQQVAFFHCGSGTNESNNYLKTTNALDAAPFAGTGIVDGATYTLTVAVGTSSRWANFDVFRPRLVADGVFVTDGNVGIPTTGGTFEDKTKSFIAGADEAGDALKIDLYLRAFYNAELHHVDLDNVRVTAACPTVMGDANLDGMCDTQDFTILKDRLGLDPATWYDANFNDDTICDTQDFTILKDSLGNQVGVGAGGGGGGAPVPEPATIGLLALGAAALIRRRRR